MSATGVTIALAGDVMLGRLVADAIAERGPRSVWGDVLTVRDEADLFLVNLECALTRETARWHDGSYKTFSFRAGPEAVACLTAARVSCVSLANNHVLDFGERGLLETLVTLDRAGIAHAGAGRDARDAAVAARLEASGVRVAVLAFSDHPEAWAATDAAPGINHTAVSTEARSFARVERAIRAAREDADVVVFSIHWGPNMSAFPTPAFRDLARAVRDAGAAIFWGHSAHVVQAVERDGAGTILYDTGDFVDDYAVDADLRNDLSALFLVRVEDGRVERVDLVPVAIEDRVTRLARGSDRDRFARLFRERCAPFGTVIEAAAGRLGVRGAGAEARA